jgi:hypothetical protein
MTQRLSSGCWVSSPISSDAYRAATLGHPPADASRMQRVTDAQMSGLAFGSCLSG